MRNGKKSKNVCDVFGIEFFATIFSEHHLELVNAIGASTVKIASSDINHIPLIVKAAQTGMSVQLILAMPHMMKLLLPLIKLRNRAIDKTIIHHCPTGYPAAPR